MSPETNALLHGRYRIVRQIGAGGMGAVFEAIDTRLLNTVAVKQTKVSDPVADRAFEREAHILAALRHPALPVVIDYFADADGQFLVMQFIEGEDLSRVLKRQNGGCSPDDVLEWAHAILDALSYLHARQPPIVHRDIKPANLRRTPRGEIVLLDFGLAKSRLDSETRPAVERSLYGFTLNYAPPEQVEGRITDARSDIYALGATLYHLATGIPPPTAWARSASAYAGRPDPLVAAHLVNPGVGEAFSRVLTRALELDPNKRFAQADQMREALLDHEESRPPQRDPPKPAVVARRVDAAMPSQPEVGRQTDLLVQVRFADSPLLGIEDWPTRRRPVQIEQGSESLQVSYPVDAATGALLAARLRIRLVAPDFVVGGAAEQLIEVPPDAYSKRVAFLLTPRRPGFCRVNVEVYAADALYLGTIPVEVEAAAGAEAARAAERELRVANLVLRVFTRRADDTGTMLAASLLPAIEGARAAALPAAAARGLDAAVSATAGKVPSTKDLDLGSPLDVHPEPLAEVLGAALDPKAAPIPAGYDPLADDSPDTADAPLTAMRSRRTLTKALLYVPLALIVLGTSTLWLVGWRVNSLFSTGNSTLTTAESAPQAAAPLQTPPGGSAGADATELAKRYSVASSDATRELETRFRVEVVGTCRLRVDGRYPFGNGSDLPLVDFGDVFGYGGLYDRFFNENLGPLVDRTSHPWVWRDGSVEPPGMSRMLVLAAFEGADHIRQMFFAPGSRTPKLAFRVTLSNLDPEAERFYINVDGQERAVTPGTESLSSLEWPGPQRLGKAFYQFEDNGAPPESGYVDDGPWALFRLVEGIPKAPSAQGQPGSGLLTVLSFNTGNHRAQLTIEATNSKANPFALGDSWRQFKCTP